MTLALAETRRNASVCGCSSMAEQKLPKLLTSAVSASHDRAKRRLKLPFGFKRVGFARKTYWGPLACQRTSPGPPSMEGSDG